MACVFNLFDKLGGTPDTGGRWTQESGPQAITISGGYLGTVDTCSAALGTYTFRYDFNDFDVGNVVTVTVGNPPDPGLDTLLDATEGDGVITLFDQLDGTPDAGGSWTVNPNPPAGTVDLGLGTYDPAAGDGALNGVPYVFTYSVTEPGTDPECTCCTKTATLTITVYLGGSTGNDAAITVCADE